MTPLNTKTTADGKFPCGRKSGFESSRFIMPEKEPGDYKIEMTYEFNETQSIQ